MVPRGLSCARCGPSPLLGRCGSCGELVDPAANEACPSCEEPLVVDGWRCARCRDAIDPSKQRCGACAEPLVLAAGRCRACGEPVTAPTSSITLRWEGDLLVVPDRTAWPDRCLRCGVTAGARVPRAFAGRLHAVPLCGPCGDAERNARLLSSAAGVAIVCAAVAGLPGIVALVSESAPAVHPALALAGGVAAMGLLIYGWWRTNRRHVHLARSRQGEVLLRLPDPAASRAALGLEERRG
jgi:hypothetical protein